VIVVFDIEVAIVSAGLKILAILTVLASLDIWSRLNSALVPLAGRVGPLLIAAGIGVGLVLYALGLLVQRAGIAPGRGGG
jgi:hypothetical protein